MLTIAFVLQRFPLKFIFLVLTLAGGALFASLLASILFKKIPSDFTRTEKLLGFIKNEIPERSTLIFGNSIAMDGFDAKMFTSQACIPNSFNLSSPGQNQLESLLLISSIESKTPERVIHFFTAPDLHKQDYLSQQVMYNFLLYNYQINDFVLNALKITNNQKDTALFTSNRFNIAFESRWLIPNFINTQFRQFFRKDLTLGKLAEELYYPRNYTTRLPEEQRMFFIHQANPKDSVLHFSMDSIKWELIKHTTAFLKKKNIEYLVVIAPVNPELSSYTRNYYKEMKYFFEHQSLSDVKFLNLTSLLNKEDFVDHIHPTNSGARKITLKIAENLSKCSSKQ